MSIRQEFVSAIYANQAAFDLELSSEATKCLADYFDLVQENNPLLHLVAPCTPEEFAVRHILESLTLPDFLPRGARFADVGTGAGLPSIPCLIIRPDLHATLIESKEKKSRFLEIVLTQLRLNDQVRIINSQFEEVTKKDFEIVTCRALDKFTEKLPRLLKWSGDRKFLFFGGPSLENALLSSKMRYTKKLMPLSERRYLFIGGHQNT